MNQRIGGRSILRAVRPAVRRFADLAVGQRVELTRTVSDADVQTFTAVSGDDNAIHLDAAFADRTRFAGRIAHGALTFGFMAAAQTRLVGSGAVWIDAAVRFTAPVRIGVTVTAVSEIAALDRDRRVLTLRSTVRLADGTIVMTGESHVKHPRELDSLA
jgi:3-hydroxybutyryl-CoA dehydratase